jgi:hypothetical protein
MVDGPRATRLPKQPESARAPHRSLVTHIVASGATSERHAGISIAFRFPAVALHRRKPRPFVPSWTALNSTPRRTRGIPYPLTFDIVRCHA